MYAPEELKLKLSRVRNEMRMISGLSLVSFVGFVALTIV